MGKQEQWHKGSKMRRKCVDNKVAGVFSCGQRDLCRLSEAQPQAGNKYGVKIRKMCGKDVLSYGKDVILAKKEQAQKEQKCGEGREKRLPKPHDFAGHVTHGSKICCF